MSHQRPQRPYLRKEWFYEPNSFKRLWIAVLTMAVDDAVFGPAAWELKGFLEADKTAFVQSVKQDALQWIEDDSREAQSFRWVCENLQLDVVYVRRNVAEQIAAQRT